MSRIMILRGDFTEDYELAVPYHYLKMFGHEVQTTSPGKADGQYITTCIHDFKEKYQAVTEWEGHRFWIDTALHEIDVADYAALILPGGRACETLRNAAGVKSLVTAFVESQKVVATICLGLQILLATFLMKDRSVTGHPCCGSPIECRTNGIPGYDRHGKIEAKSVILKYNKLYQVTSTMLLAHHTPTLRTSMLAHQEARPTDCSSVR